MTQEIRERLAVLERIVEDLHERMDIKHEKIDKVVLDIARISARHQNLESKFDAFTCSTENKLHSIMRAQDQFATKFNEIRVIDETQRKLEEAQKRKLIKVLSVLGTIVISIVSNLDKIHAVVARPSTEPVVITSLALPNFPPFKGARLFNDPFLIRVFPKQSHTLM